MSASLVRTSDLDARDAAPDAKRDTLFEQLGNTAAISRPPIFVVALADGETDPAPNPLPDYGE